MKNIRDKIKNPQNSFLDIRVHDLENKKDFQEWMLRAGIYVPYADGFAFHNKGVLLVGHSGAGKTTLAKYLHDNYSNVDLAAHDMVLLDVEDGGKISILKNNFQLGLWNRRFLHFFPDFSIEDYELQLIVYLRSRQDKKFPAFDDIIEHMFFDSNFSGPSTFRFLRKKDRKHVYDAFRHIPYRHLKIDYQQDISYNASNLVEIFFKQDKKRIKK